MLIGPQEGIIMERLILVRHGETIWNAEKRLQGQTDIPLSDVGRQQAHQLAARLAGESLDAVVSSDLSRAMETAAIIAGPHALAVRADARLRQSHRGQWEGQTLAEITAQVGGDVTEEQLDHPPGGEPPDRFVGRLRAFLDNARHDDADQTVLAVAHGHVLRVLIALALEIDLADAWRFRTGNASLSELRFSDKGAILHSLNDNCHLDRVIYRETDA
jgi:broad specificity phosphatase PhoE